MHLGQTVDMMPATDVLDVSNFTTINNQTHTRGFWVCIWHISWASIDPLVIVAGRYRDSFAWLRLPSVVYDCHAAAAKGSASAYHS